MGDELISKIRDVHIIGIRSKTKLTKAVLDEAKNLLGIGCFCIGTNQVDLKAAADKGVSTRRERKKKRKKTCQDGPDDSRLSLDCRI